MSQLNQLSASDTQELPGAISLNRRSGLSPQTDILEDIIRRDAERHLDFAWDAYRRLNLIAAGLEIHSQAQPDSIEVRKQ